MENYDDIIMDEQAFSKEAYAERKKQEREALNELIEKTAERVLSEPKALAGYLQIQARLGQASVNNALLAFVQKPDATQLFSYEEWRKRGRNVQRGEGEHAVKQFRKGGEYTRTDGTMATGFRVERCFDLSQTYGRPVAERPVLKTPIKNRLKALMTGTPVPVRLSDNVPENVGALYTGNAIEVARGQEGGPLFFPIARALIRAKGMDDVFLCDCAASAACLRLGVAPQYPKNIPEELTAMDAKDKRAVLGEIREAACELSGRVEENLRIEQRREENAR